MNIYDFNGSRGFDIGSFSNNNKTFQGKNISSGQLKQEAEKLNNLLFKDQIQEVLKKKEIKRQENNQ